MPQKVYNSPFIINIYNMSSNGDLRASFTSQTPDLNIPNKVNDQISNAFNNHMSFDPKVKAEAPKKRALVNIDALIADG